MKVKSMETSDVLGEAENRERKDNAGTRTLLGNVALWEEGQAKGTQLSAYGPLSPAVKCPKLSAAGIAIYKRGSRLPVAVTTVH